MCDPTGNREKLIYCSKVMFLIATNVTETFSALLVCNNAIFHIWNFFPDLFNMFMSKKLCIFIDLS